MRNGTLSNVGALVRPSSDCPRATLNSSSLFSGASALQDYINSDHPSHGQKIHSHILKTGFEPKVNIFIKLLILHIKSSCFTQKKKKKKSSCWSYARQVFDGMPHRTLTAYNYTLAGYVRNGFVEKSFALVREPSLSDQKPDAYTFSMISKGSSTSGVLGRKSMPRL